MMPIDHELADLMKSVAEKSLRLMNQWKTPSPSLPWMIEKYLDFFKSMQELILSLLKNPEKVWEMQLAYTKDAQSLLQAHLNCWLEGKSVPTIDKRFNSEEWTSNPFFNLLSQQYLLASEHLNALFLHLEYGDKQLAKRVQFFMRQYLDAISPDNFFHTNPQLMAETIQSHGKNLLRGLENFLSDMENDSSRLIIKMTDTSAFKIGKNIATTKGQVIFKNDLMELIQYTPQTEQVYQLPLLIIPPWINKYYILDLSPHNSLINWIVKQGITVFTISWVNPGAAHAQKGLEDYLLQGPLTAIEVIQKQLQVRKVNTLGFCIGGTLQAMMLAYLAAAKRPIVHSATFLASMIDFSDPGDIAVYIDEQQIEKLESRMEKKGFLEGHFMASAFNSLRASDLIWSFFIKNYLRGQPPVPFDILYWNADSTNMPAKMHSQYLRWMYLNNDLVKPGKIKLQGVPLDVTQIKNPTFFVSTQKDHIAPWQTTYLGFLLVQGKKEFILGGSGHIAGIIIPPGSKKYGYYTNKACPSDSETWLQGAKLHPGSWWPYWIKWLKKEAGKKIAAPESTALPLSPLRKAPGSYVKN